MSQIYAQYCWLRAPVFLPKRKVEKNLKKESEKIQRLLKRLFHSTDCNLPFLILPVNRLLVSFFLIPFITFFWLAPRELSWNFEVVLYSSHKLPCIFSKNYSDLCYFDFVLPQAGVLFLFELGAVQFLDNRILICCLCIFC